ncbi:MAG: 16S rRNA (adenine(1518)-N(6)/adenine(1519)-N(6))-dimethyltransferase RsmA [Alphaproteobacteria bacterium]|nr:16S rRNA (adenine(1518)-N(6)/adenine(1519)-N(6))-dimethyltransferase RsmA [Alphaproteobacteria bacterium]
MSPDGPPSLAATIRRHGLTADKRLGQHFLVDPAILARIAAAAEPLAGVTVVEVGAGPGGLTRALLATDAVRVVAVETDRRCVAALDELAAAAGGRLRVVAGDALALDRRELAAPPTAIVANLPYNIATELIVRWLRAPAGLVRLVLLVQREVAARLAAAPGTAAYGRLSVLAQWAARVEALFELPPGAFRPPPKVHSRVVRLTPHREPPVPVRLATLERVTAAAFGQRRKMLRSSLKSLGRDPAALCAAAGIAPARRAETLTLAEFAALADALERE